MTAKPRLGFLGVGWIGRNRLEALVAADAGEVVAVSDADPVAAEAVADSVPGAHAVPDYEKLLAVEGLDGVVIATPSALHSEQCLAALDAGLAVFCQKPLSRTSDEAEAVVTAARHADRLLGVDLSYRHLAATAAARHLLDSDRIGSPYAVDATFHNAYGPDKAWFLDPALAGGGCAIDLGTHLIDLALDLLGWPEVTSVRSALYRRGRRLELPASEVEDYAIADIELATGTVVRLACSWFLPAGRDAVIQVTLQGSDGAVAIENVAGSFYDFRAEHRVGTSATELVAPPDPWGGRALVAWAHALGGGAGFDPAAERLVTLARVVDRVYGR